MTKLHQGTKPFFLVEEVAAEMVAGGYGFEPPPILMTIRLRDVLKRMSNAEPALRPDGFADQERERRRHKLYSTP